MSAKVVIARHLPDGGWQIVADSDAGGLLICGPGDRALEGESDWSPALIRGEEVALFFADLRWARWLVGGNNIDHPDPWTWGEGERRQKP